MNLLNSLLKREAFGYRGNDDIHISYQELYHELIFFLLMNK